MIVIHIAYLIYKTFNDALHRNTTNPSTHVKHVEIPLIHVSYQKKLKFFILTSNLNLEVFLIFNFLKIINKKDKI